MDIQLIEPTSILDDEYCAMMADIAAGPPQEGYMLPDLTGSFSEFVERLHRESRGEGLAPGRVRQTTWWAVDDQDNLLGEIRLRHELTSALLIEGGNIGYVVRPSARRQGAATRMLELVLREASQFGLKRVLLTCDADNEASRRTIELNGGVSDPQPIVPEQNWLRYWINISDSHRSDLHLSDLWSTSSSYARNFQPEQEIASTLAMLDLGSAQVLMDNGCGNGAFAIAAAEQFPDCSVFAFDGLQSAVDECAVRAGPLLQHNLHVKVASADALPLADDVADRALSRFVLHHVEFPEAMFHEMKRVLVTGGLLLLQTPCNIWDASMADTLREIFLIMDDSHPRFYYEPEDILERLRGCGLRPESHELQKFHLPDVSRAMVDVIHQRGVADQLSLEPVEVDSWRIELSWLRVIARS